MKTIEELQGFATAALDFAVDYLREHGTLYPMFHLFRSDGSTEIVSAPGEMANSGRAKEMITAVIRAKVAAGGYEAVLMMSDTFMGRVTSAEAVKEIEERRLNVEEATAAGLCTMRQAIVLSLDSPLYTELRTQYYRRDDEAERIDLDELVVVDVSDHEISGRMVKFFPRASRA